jgi:hypothetical protein
LGPLDFIVIDAGTNFVGTKFKQPVKQLLIEIKEVPVEAYNSISKVERYYTRFDEHIKLFAQSLKRRESMTKYVYK